MATIYDATDVFTPTEVPTVTYVYRQDKDLESQLKLAVKTPGLIVSLSGPSKSGKTVLMKRVIPSDDLITVSGASIKTPDQLWDRVLNWMDAPIETSTKSAATATLYQLPRSVTHGPGWPSVHECDSVAASSVRGEPWLPLFPFVPISTLLPYALWPNSRAIPIRPGAFWHWPRSMMDSPGQRPPGSAA
jgi:hypothetical protein